MARLFLLFLISILICCTNEQSNQSQTIGNLQQKEASTFNDESEIDPPRTAETTSPKSKILEKGSKIIKSGNLNFEVTDLKESKKQADVLVSKYQAYYESEHYNSYGNRISYSLQIRIPNEKFDSVLIELETGFGKLLSKNINAKDVTEEYVDLKIRLDNNLAYLSQYQEILKKAKTIKDILEVQEKIRRIEEEIESKKGRMQFLDDKVKYSTLKIEISELVKRQFSNQPTFGRKIANAFKNGVDGFLSFLVILANLWPLVLFTLLFIIFRKRIFNIFKRK